MNRTRPIRSTDPSRASTSKDGATTKNRIFEAARVRFSHSSYEAVGVREIANDAGVDAALVIRYFGSKEKLFREIAAGAFEHAELLQGDSAQRIERILDQLLTARKERDWRIGYDPFRLLLCSISSQIAGPIVSEAFHRSFVNRLSSKLEGPLRNARAALAASYILGIALLRVTDHPSILDRRGNAFIRQQLETALQNCILNDGGKS